VLDFNWLSVRMMCWVRVHVRISRSLIVYVSIMSSFWAS